MSMPRSRITRTALGCSGLGWLPALTALDRAVGQLLGERLGHLRARAVAGAQEQHAREPRAAARAHRRVPGQRQARVQRDAGARQQLAAARQIEGVVGVAAVGGAATHRHKATVAQLTQVVGDQALAPARQRRTARPRADRCAPARSAAATAAGAPPAVEPAAANLRHVALSRSRAHDTSILFDVSASRATRRGHTFRARVSASKRRWTS